jgi:hypothetical protein
MSESRARRIAVAVFIGMFGVFFAILWNDERPSSEEIAFYSRQKLDAQVKAASPDSIAVGSAHNIQKTCDAETGNLIYWYTVRGGVAVVPGGCDKR